MVVVVVVVIVCHGPMLMKTRGNGGTTGLQNRRMTPHRLTRRAFNLSAASAAALVVAPSFAQSAWPSKPIRIIVPYTPGRLHRPDGAAGAAGAFGAAGPAGGDRQQARRQQPDRRRCGGEVGAGRQHLRRRHRRLRRQHHALPEAALRPEEGPGRRVADGRLAAARGGQQRRALQDREGADRLCRANPGKVSFGSSRQRLGRAPDQRAVEVADQDLHDPHPVPRRGAGADRSDGRPDPAVLRRADRPHQPGQGRQGAPDRRGERPAPAGGAGRADLHRAGLRRLHRQHLGRHAGAGAARRARSSSACRTRWRGSSRATRPAPSSSMGTFPAGSTPEEFDAFIAAETRQVGPGDQDRAA